MKNKKILFLLASTLLLAACGTKPQNSASSNPEVSSVASSESAAESISQSDSQSSEAVSSSEKESSSVKEEVKLLASLKGSIVMDYSAYGMGIFTVDVTLNLNENKTGSYTLNYSGSDPFTYEEVTWDATESGSIVANIIEVTPEGKVSPYAANIYKVGEAYLGYAPTNLGSCLISNAELNEVTTVAGSTVMDYSMYGMGKYTCEISINLLTKGLALYNLSYTTEAGGKTEVSAFTLPTTWSTDETTGVTSVNTYNVSAEGEVKVVAAPIYFGGKEAIEFAAIKVGSNLGEFYCTNGKAFIASLSGKTEVDYGTYGKFSCEYTVGMFDGWALITADYGAQGNFTAAYAMTANADKTQYTVSGFVWGSEAGQTQDVVITNTDGVYTATMQSGLGEINVTSAAAAQ